MKHQIVMIVLLPVTIGVIIHKSLEDVKKIKKLIKYKDKN